MKKFILMALVASAATIYQPAKAQVSVNINLGTQPRYQAYGYHTDYYATPVVHRTYYAPAPRYVYVERNNYNRKKYYKSSRVYQSNYRPSKNFYSVKQVHYKNSNKSFNKGRGHGKGRH